VSTAVYELYDYEKDPLETKNLAGDLPDVVKQLCGLLAKQPEAKPQIQVPGDTPKKKAKKNT
jgi:iduronate 2-sulfatase